MEPRVNMITLGVGDWAEATAFYEQGLGFPRMDFGDDGISFFEMRGSWLALYPWRALADDAGVSPDGSGFRGVTLGHVVEAHDDVHRCLDRAQAAGGRVVKPAQVTDWGGYSGYFADLDGYLWEVAVNPFFWPGPR